MTPNYFLRDLMTQLQRNRADVKSANIIMTQTKLVLSYKLPTNMIHLNQHPYDIVNYCETLMVSSKLKRRGRDKSVMSTLFNVLAPVQWLDGQEWQDYKIKVQVKLAWIAGNQIKRGGHIADFTEKIHEIWKRELKYFDRQNILLFCESLKSYYYFHCQP